MDHDAICDLFSFLADLAINAVFPEHPNAHHAFQVFPTWKGGVNAVFACLIADVFACPEIAGYACP